MKKLLSTIIITSTCIGIVIYFLPRKVEIKTIIQQIPINAPVLDRIQQCESHGQFGADGQVYIHINSNGTYDTGEWQINSIWNATATKLGYNLMVEKDNKAFALYLFENYGDTNWFASKSCWNKN